MALVDLCYLCPECGADPMTGKKDSAWCGSCGLRVARRRGRLLLTSPRGGGGAVPVTGAELARRMDERGGPLKRATRRDGAVEYSARALVSWRVSEEPVRYRGLLRGYSESMGAAVPGSVAVDAEAVAVTEGARERKWRHLDLCAVQGTSSSLQLSLPGDELVQLRFLDDSPRRWEALIRRLVRDAYARSGRGRVVEFQPRIVTPW